MMIAGEKRWPIASAWRAAAEVSARAYGVERADITAPSRGRGPRPPRGVWSAKKMAVHLAVLLSGQDYAALGRHIGLHRDTIASHCAAMRQEASDSDTAEVSAQCLEVLARGLLENEARNQIEAVRAHLAMLEASVADLNGLGGHHSPIRPTSDRSSDSVRDDHGNVIVAQATAKVGLQ